MASFPKDNGSPYHRVVFRKTYRRPDGTKAQKSKTFYFRKDEFTRAEVKEWKKRREIAFKDREWAPWEQASHIRREFSLEEAIEAYLSHIKAQVAASTYELRKINLDQFARSVGKATPVEAIGSAALNDFINEKGKKYPTRKNRKKHLSLFYNWLSDYHDIDKPIMEVIVTRAIQKHYQTKQHKSFLTEEQVLEVIGNVHSGKNTRHNSELLRDFYKLSFYTTRRRSEVLSIRAGWIFDDAMMQLGEAGNLPKSQMIEFVPLPAKAHKILLRLKEGKKDNEKLFHFNKRYVSGEFRDALQVTYPELVDKVSLHNLRDSGIMHLLYVKELPVQKVMEITGHATIRSLELYTHKYAKITYQQSLNEN